MNPETDFTDQVDIEAILAEMDFAGSCIEQLLDAVAQARKRIIVLVPFPMPDVLQYGAWLAGPKADYIFYDSDTAQVHQAHIILHELSHIVLGHKTLRVDSEDTDALVEALTPVLMRDMRNVDVMQREQEAESLASHLQKKIIHKVGLHALTVHSATAPVWSELIYGLGLDR